MFLSSIKVRVMWESLINMTFSDDILSSRQRVQQHGLQTKTENKHTCTFMADR